MDSWAEAYITLGNEKHLPLPARLRAGLVTSDQAWCSLDLEIRLRAYQFMVGV